MNSSQVRIVLGSEGCTDSVVVESGCKDEYGRNWELGCH